MSELMKPPSIKHSDKCLLILQIVNEFLRNTGELVCSEQNVLISVLTENWNWQWLWIENQPVNQRPVSKPMIGHYF